MNSRQRKRISRGWKEELLRLKDVKRELQIAARRTSEVAPQRRRTLVKNSFRTVSIAAAAAKKLKPTEHDEYGRWFARHRLSADETAKLPEQSRRFSYRPLVSILMPTFNPNEEFLTAAVESVIAQVYENWELILVDDGSDDPARGALLENMKQRDARIQIGSQDHGGISSALNAGLALAKR